MKVQMIKKERVLGAPRKKWYFRIVAVNGRILCHGENYSSKTACMKTATLMAKRLRVKLEVHGQ